MRTAINVGIVLALVAVSFWAPHAAFVPIEVRGPGFMNTVTEPAVTSDFVPADPVAWRKSVEESSSQRQKVIGEIAPGKFRVIEPEKTHIEPTKADRYVCYLGHMLRRGPSPNSSGSEVVSISGLGAAEVKVDTNRLLIEYALIIAACALMHQLVALIPPDPETPPQLEAPAPSAAPPAAPATEAPQPPAAV